MPRAGGRGSGGVPERLLEEGSSVRARKRHGIQTYEPTSVWTREGSAQENPWRDRGQWGRWSKAEHGETRALQLQPGLC